MATYHPLSLIALVIYFLFFLCLVDCQPKHDSHGRGGPPPSQDKNQYNEEEAMRFESFGNLEKLKYENPGRGRGGPPPSQDKNQYNEEEAMRFESFGNLEKLKYEDPGRGRGGPPPSETQGLASFNLDKVPTIYYRYNLTTVGTRLLLVFTKQANGTLPAKSKQNTKSRSLCDVTGEIKACVDSLETAREFVVQILGKNVSVVTTPPGKLQYYWVTGSAKTIGDGALACHNKGILEASISDNAIYSCHYAPNSQVRLVPLVGQDGTHLQAVTVCHMNTSEWEASAFKLQVLKMKPGPPVCHFMCTDDLVWYRPVKIMI